MYIQREIEATVEELLRQFKVVLVTGARQVGKTTLLRHGRMAGINYVSLEDPSAFSLASKDTLLFFKTNAIPLIIDEVQRVPDLFRAVKFEVDQNDSYGQVVLTGSQTYHLMKGVSESLAGRIGILEMAGLSLREVIGEAGLRGEYIPRETAEKDLHAPGEGFDLWRIIQRGSMPQLMQDDISWERFYSSYVQSYLERDVRDLIAVKDESRFFDFMVACAARTGQLFNASDVARVVDVDYKTVQSWVSILQASGIIRILRPFWPNYDKRLTKTPKLYFMDAGLVCYLTRWTTSEQLRRGAMAGHVFETFVVSEVLKSYMNAGANLRDVWFYRDSRKREIDLVIQEGRVLHPVEIKMGMTIGSDAVKNFKYLEGYTNYEVGFGHVICQTDKPYYITRDVQAIPVWAI